MLKPGDIFLSRNPMALGRAINAVQLFWSTDNQSKYSHAGIVLGESGETLEALHTVKHQNLYRDYAGQEILIGRWNYMTRERFDEGMKFIQDRIGKVYPYHRLLFFLLPPIAKYVSIGPLVCSELTAKFLVGADVLAYYKGRNPDDLADIVNHRKQWEKIFEGQLGGF